MSQGVCGPRPSPSALFVTAAGAQRVIVFAASKKKVPNSLVDSCSARGRHDRTVAVQAKSVRSR